MSRRVFGLFLIALIFCSAGGVSAQSGFGPQVAAGVQSFRQVYQIVKDNYAEPVNDDKAIYEGAIVSSPVRCLASSDKNTDLIDANRSQ